MNEPRLILGDCREVLPLLKGERIDAVVTDPPYGVGWRGTGNKSGVLAQTTQFVGVGIIGDDEPFDPSPWLDFPHVILWGANHYADRLPPRGRWLVWDKRDGLTSNDLADCELAWTNDTRPARLFSHRWMGMLKDSDRGKRRVHPTQKPVPVMSWCLKQLDLPPNATILDPYMGSGTTAIAAMKAGYRFIGIEIEPAYFAVAQRRVREAATPLLDAFEASAAAP